MSKVLDKTDKLHEKSKLPKIIRWEIYKMNGPVSIQETEFVVKNLHRHR